MTFIVVGIRGGGWVGTAWFQLFDQIKIVSIFIRVGSTFVFIHQTKNLQKINIPEHSKKPTKNRPAIDLVLE